MEYDFFIKLLASLGGAGAIVIGLSRWLGRLWSKRIIQLEKSKLDEELERTKAILQSDIEKTKAELSIQVNILQQRFNSINQERMSAIVSNYQLLANAWLECRWAIQPDEIGREKPPVKERLDKAANALDEYFADFERKKIFLSEGTQESVYQFLFYMWDSLNQLRIFSESNDDYEARLSRLYDKWIHDLKPKMDLARASIESEYKRIIGINEHNRVAGSL